jgi:hypothetical protein
MASAAENKKSCIISTARAAVRALNPTAQPRRPALCRGQDMTTQPVILVLVAWLASAFLTEAGAQPAPDRLQAGLVDAMRLNTQTGERIGDSGAAIRAYIQAGYLRARPEKRFDYTDYRILRRPARLLGQELVLIEEEYLTRFIGCCVNAGVGAVVRATADTSAIDAFAAANRCSIAKGRDVIATLESVGLKPAQGEYLQLSCRERDVLATRR